MGENMRKFRNIIIGLIAFCSTILFSACSCGEKPDTTVYPTSITLSCVDTDNYTHTIEDGVMTGDLFLLSTLENKKKVNTEEFLIEVNERLKKMM